MHKQDEKELNGGRLCAWQDYHTAFGKLVTVHSLHLTIVKSDEI